jgi:hypothetical protein
MWNQEEVDKMKKEIDTANKREMQGHILMDAAIFNANPEFLAALNILSGLCSNSDNRKSPELKVEEAIRIGKMFVTKFSEQK